MNTMKWVMKLMDAGRQVGVLHTDSQEMMEWYGGMETFSNYAYEQGMGPVVDWDEPHRDIVIVSAGMWTKAEYDRYPGNPAFVETMPGYWDWRIDAELDYDNP